MPSISVGSLRRSRVRAPSHVGHGVIRCHDALGTIGARRSDDRGWREPVPERDPARRAVVTGLGAVMPIGNDFPTYWANLAGRRDRHAHDPELRRVRARGPDRRRGPRLRPDAVHGRQDGPPDEPVHPLRDGRRQGGRRRLRDRLRGHDAGAARPRRRRRQHRRRRDRADHRRHPRPRPEGAAVRVAVRDPGAVGLDGRGACCRWSTA